MNTCPAHAPLTQTFKSFGLTYRALGVNRWHVEGHGEVTNEGLYALQRAAR